MPPTRPTRLRRDLGLLEAVGVGLGAIVGAGIFVVTGLAAGMAGPAFIVSLALAGLAAGCNGYSAARLAAVFPRAGGAYEFGRRLLHPTAGYAAGWLFILSKTTAGAAVAIGFGRYLSELFPAIPARPASLTAVILLTGANLAGIRKSGRLNTAIVAVTLGVLLLFSAVCATSFRADNLHPFAPGGLRGILEASAILFFAYTGYARVATLSEEVRDPRRTIPRAVSITLASAFLLYAAVSVTALGAIGAGMMASSSAPLTAAARHVAPGWLPGLVTFGAATAMLGVLLSQIMGVSRTIFAMARQKDLPAPLAYISRARAVPSAAICLVGGAIALLAAAGGLKAAVSTASFTILVYYMVMNAAAMRLALRRRLHPAPFWISTAGLLFCILLAASLPSRTILWGTALVLIGFLLRPAFHYWNRGRKSPP